MTTHGHSRHRRLALATVACALGLCLGALAAAPALAQARERARVQAFTIVNQAGIPRGQLRRAERAIVAESVILRRYWHTPVAHFTRAGGWPVYLVADEPRTLRGQACSCLGFHDVSASGRPYIVAYAALDAGTLRWSVVLSHEVMETLVDPHLDHVLAGQLAEVCDDVASYPPVWIDGVPVTDFVTPAWFAWHRDPAQAPSGVRWDAAGRLSWVAPGDPTSADGWIYRP